MKEQDLGRGNKIIGFDSTEEMLEYMDSKESEVAEQMKDLLEPQKGIGYGSYALRVIPYDDDTSLAIFGYIYTEDEIREQEIEAGASTEDGELEFILAGMADAHERGYRYGTWHSVVLPDGEPGDAHLVTLWPITEADYHTALDLGWEMPTHLAERIREELNEHGKE